ncbi:MAG: hypothetical protein WCV62_01600 [Candidatus Peribacteraceae bacterium]|jgi:hypothetical protein
MHFCVYIFIPKEGDIKEHVSDALRLYGIEHEVPPYKEYLDADEISVMAKHYRVRRSDRKALVSFMKDWNGNPGGIDRKGLFSVKTANPQAKWDFYEIGGRWNCFPDDVIAALALLEKKNLKEILPAAMVTPDGLWHERDAFIVDGWMKWRMDRKNDGIWLKEVKEALRMHPDTRIVCVDIHR